MSIADKLLLLSSTKTAIASAIEAQGVTVGEIPFSQYPAKIAEIEGGGGGGGGWQRPADWLPLPTVGPTEQKFVGLWAVYDNDANFISLSASGDYTVDWGDGTSDTYASGATASHTYNYATISNSTLCSRGYKQVIVTVTPSTTLTALDIAVRPTQYAGAKSTAWLDVTIGSPALTSLAIGSSLMTSRLVEQVTIVSHAIGNMSYMFSSCSSLHSVPFFDTGNVTNMSNMFSSCPSLQSVPLFDTGNVTSMSYMFSSCSSLHSVPFFDTGNVTNMSLMFGGCPSLQSVPLFDTGNVTSMSGMFSSCTNLATAALSGTKVTISYINCRLSRQALVDIFNGLGTPATTQTITVTGNFGAAELTAEDRLIATSKNWAIVG